MLNAKDITSPADLNRYVCSKLTRPAIIGLTEFLPNDVDSGSNTCFFVPRDKINRVLGFFKANHFKVAECDEIASGIFSLVIGKDANSSAFCNLMGLLAATKTFVGQAEKNTERNHPHASNKLERVNILLRDSFQRFGFMLTGVRVDSLSGLPLAMQQLGIDVQSATARDEKIQAPFYPEAFQLRFIGSESMDKMLAVADIARGLRLNARGRD